MADVLADDPDRDLLPAAIDGDLDAFEALILRYQSRTVSFSRTLTGRAEEAEDLAQEVFVRVFKAPVGFGGQSSFRTWLYIVAVNVARTHRHRRTRQQTVWMDSGADEAHAFDPLDPAELESALVARDAIERALDELPPELRIAVTLRDVHGLDYRDIAETMGVPIGMESRIFRGRQRLRAALASQGVAKG